VQTSGEPILTICTSYGVFFMQRIAHALNILVALFF